MVAGAPSRPSQDPRLDYGPRHVRLSTPCQGESSQSSGELSEWFKEHAWKACIRATVSGVRIPHSPPVKRPARGVLRRGRWGIRITEWLAGRSSGARTACGAVGWSGSKAIFTFEFRAHHDGRHIGLGRCRRGTATRAFPGRSHPGETQAIRGPGAPRGDEVHPGGRLVCGSPGSVPSIWPEFNQLAKVLRSTWTKPRSGSSGRSYFGTSTKFSI